MDYNEEYVFANNTLLNGGTEITFYVVTFKPLNVLFIDFEILVTSKKEQSYRPFIKQTVNICDLLEAKPVNQLVQMIYLQMMAKLKYDANKTCPIQPVSFFLAIFVNYFINKNIK